MKSLKKLSVLIALGSVYNAPTSFAQTLNQSNQVQTLKDKNMKEYILLVHLPVNYGSAQAAEVREKWNALTGRWKAGGIFVTSFIFPTESYVVTGHEGNVKKDAVISNDTKLASSIIVKAKDYEEALELAKKCPILEQGGNIEVRETFASQESKNKELIRDLYENILNNRHMELLDGLISPDFTGPGGTKGITAFSATVQSVIAGFPDIKWVIEDLVAEGDKVVVRWHWNGTNSASFRGLPISNKSVTDNAIAIYQLKDGKVINTWIQGDRLGVLVQIDAIPADF